MRPALLFQDPDLFQFPGSALVRKPLAYLIASLRAPKSRVYFEYMGGKSPITELTVRQAEALEKRLNEEGNRKFKVVVAMRYWTPSTDDALDELVREGIRRVILLPLYPHYSYTTTRSSHREWRERCRQRNIRFDEEILIPDYHDHPDYIRAVAQRIEEAIERFPPEQRKDIHLLFSAHGIPLREIEQGDPYEKQIHRSVELVMDELKNDWVHHLSYQSRVGPSKWLEPTTIDMIHRLSDERVKQVVAVPISFVSDHSETLYELKKLYGDLAASLHVEQYELMPALNDSSLFIQALKDLVLKAAP